MIEESATVVRVEEGFAWVSTHGESGCSSCHQSGSCGVSVLGRLFAPRREPVKALNQAGASVGDDVVIGLSEEALVRGSLLVYFLPLAGMIGFGLIVGSLVGEGGAGEVLTIVFSLTGLLLGLLAVARGARRAAGNSRYLPIVLRRRGLSATGGAGQAISG